MIEFRDVVEVGWVEFECLVVGNRMVAEKMLTAADGQADIYVLMYTAVRRVKHLSSCLLYTSPSPRDGLLSRMPSSA